MSYFKTNLGLHALSDYSVFTTLVGAALSFVLQIKPFIILLICLIVFDLITGLFAAKHRAEPISSKSLFRTVEKLSVELIAILACEGVRVVLIPNINITYIVVFVIAMAELKSILENIEVILGTKIWTVIKSRVLGRKTKENDTSEDKE